MSSRNQWRLFMAGLAVFFALTYLLISRAQPRDIVLGRYPTENAAWSAAITALAAGVQAHPGAAAITVHFVGPHPLPKQTEEAVSYNNRLGAFMAFANVPQPGGSWTFSHILCPKMSARQLAGYRQRPQVLLQTPQACGCQVNSGRHLMDLMTDTAVTQ